MYHSIMILCCFCLKPCVGFGNNPYPVIVDKYKSCCDKCNIKIVIPIRIMIQKNRLNGRGCPELV